MKKERGKNRRKKKTKVRKRGKEELLWRVGHCPPRLLPGLSVRTPEQALASPMAIYPHLSWEVSASGDHRTLPSSLGQSLSRNHCPVNSC